MKKYVMKAICFMVMFGLLMSTMQPVLALNDTKNTKRVYVAYVYDYSSETRDELTYLSNLENKNYSYDEFNSKNIDDLWTSIENYKVILLEISDKQKDQFLISELSNHKTNIEDWIKGGGRLYISLYGDNKNSLDWLPSDLVTTVGALEITKYDIVANEETVIKDAYQNKSIEHYFISSKGYTTLISAKTENIDAPIMISRSYGAGDIIIDTGEFEKGFHPEIVEPKIIPILVGKLVLIAAEIIAAYVVAEIAKPVISPKITSFCKNQEHEAFRYCDDKSEADIIVEFGAGVGVGAGVNLASSTIKHAAYSGVHRVAYIIDPIKYSWANGLSYAEYANAMTNAQKAVSSGILTGWINGLPGAFKDEIESTIMENAPTISEKTKDIFIDGSYAPKYPEGTPFTPLDAELVTTIENSYEVYINPISGYTKNFDVTENTKRLRIYLSADITTCAYFTNIKDPSGQNVIPTQKYLSSNTIEYKIDNPSAGIWKFVLNPDTELAGKNGVIIIQQDKFKGNVLFDTSHSESFGADGSWSTFAEELRAVGFKVDILSQAPITLDKLDDYDVFVFGGWAHSELTNDELNSIDQFVNNGGGLLLSFDEFTENVYNPLSNKYGVEFMQNVGLNDPTDDEISRNYAPVLHVASTHPIFDNVAFSQFYWVHYLKTVTSPSQAVLFSDGDTVDQNGNLAAYKPMIAVAEVGNGKVVSVADANLWNNWDWDGDGSPDIYDRDNLQLGVNIISWLSDMNSIEVSPNFNNLFINMGEVSPISEQKERLSSGTSKPLNPIVTKNLFTAASDDNLLVEFEDIFVGTDGKVKDIKDKIAIYGTENIDLIDKVPLDAILTFDREPNQSIKIGDIQQLSWNNIVIDNYTKIGYSISNITPKIPQNIQVSSSILPNTISKVSDSKVIIKYELNMLESVDDASLNLLIPKSTVLADVTINQSDALVFDTGTHYRVTYKFGATYAGDHKTIYLPATVHPKGNGMLNLIQSPQVSTTISGSTFIANATSIQINQSYRGTSFNYELEAHNLTIADNSVSMPIITSSDESTLFVLEQGKAQQGIIQIRNDGDVQTSVNIGLNNTTIMPAGSENINDSWISFDDDTFQLNARETKNITFEVIVPLTAAYNNTYIGNIEISDDNNEKTIIPTLILAIEKDLFKSLSVSTSLDQISALVATDVTINVVDDDFNPINNSAIIMTGAGVDVAPVFTGNDGKVNVSLYPRESGLIRISAEKTGYTSSETNIRVVPSINLIKNPSFENGTVNWIFYTNGIGNFMAVSPGYEGTKAAQINLSSNGTNIQLYQINVTLEPKSIYRLSFSAYSTTGHDLLVWLYQHDKPYKDYGLNQFFDLGTSWQTFSTVFTAANLTNTVNDGRLIFWLAPFGAAEDKYYIDDVILQKIGMDNSSPMVIGNTPTGANIPGNTQITVTFNETMNQYYTQLAFSTSPKTSGSFSWSGNTMIYTPYPNLAYDTSYNVTVGTSARDSAGNNLPLAYSWQFRTILPEPISNCTTISSPGVYALNTNIMNHSGTCINITSGNVFFDGTGHTIDGIDAANTHGIYVYNSVTTIKDITIYNLTLTDWSNGIYYKNSANGSIINNIVNSNSIGILFDSSRNNTIYNNYFNNTDNVTFGGTIYNNTWNISRKPVTNVVGGPNLGGNFWASPNGKGFSQTCLDVDRDGICDSQYSLNANNIDYLPLTYKPPSTGIKVTIPNGGENWRRGTIQNIIWDPLNKPCAYVKIELLKPGKPNQVIIASTLNDGLHPWTILGTQPPGNDYLIRITCTTNPVITDTSDNYFTILTPSFTVVSPNGGENWNRGTNRIINWTSTESPGLYVKIELFKAGVLKSAITTYTLNDGSHPWLIPATLAPGSDYKVKITSTTNPAVNDTSDNNFTILTPSITVASPNGGENLRRGTTKIINWSSTNNPGAYVKIELLKAGMLKSIIISSTPNDGSHPWLIPAALTPGSDYKVRITSTTSPAYNDISDNNFTILSPSITVVSPNGGENLRRGTTKIINWTSNESPGSYVKIELLKPGKPNQIIIYSTLNDGSHPWPIPATQAPGNDYKVKITSTTNPAVNDTSDNNFTILTPSITVVSPNGGENWIRGTTRIINWTSTESPRSYVKIELFKAGVLKSAIITYTLNDGSHPWPIPATLAPGADYKVKITSTINASVSDTSDYNFAILAPSTTVVSPNGGEIWTRSTTRTIKWNSTESPGTYVKIELLKPGRPNQVIILSTLNDGSHPWFIPTAQLLGTDYKVKITGITNASNNDTSDNNFTINS